MGRLVHLRHGVPFGIDYQDPWVNRWTGNEKPFSRAWASNKLAEILEPWSVRDAALITGMAPGYVAGMLERNPEVAAQSELAYMPMGTAPEDYALVRGLGRAPFLFDPADGRFHMIYAGALLPAGFVVLDAFLAGSAHLARAGAAACQEACRPFRRYRQLAGRSEGPSRAAARARGRRRGDGRRASPSHRLRRYAEPSHAQQRRARAGLDRAALHAVEGLPGDAVGTAGLRRAPPRQHGGRR